jgi:hypothetical protein
MRKTLAAALVLGLGAASPALADVLYGTTLDAGGGSTLVIIDQVTGALLTSIGPVGYTVNGLEWDNATQTLYASTGVTDPAYNGLIVINPATGAGTPIGVSGWGLLVTPAVTNLAYRSGVGMYGWWDPNEDDLVSIDLGTGIATRVGESGVGTAQNGLAFDLGGVLWMVNSGGSYYTVDTVTGAATFFGGIGTTAHHGSFSYDDGLYYGLQNTGIGVAQILVVADLSTGTVIRTPRTIDGLHTLSFRVIPEPGTIALFGLGALGLAAAAVRRRRRTSAR